jgi:hypothetical protein
MYFERCAFFNNTTNINGISTDRFRRTINLTASPYNNVPGQDYSMNSTAGAGALLAKAGYSIPAPSDVRAIGAVQAVAAVAALPPIVAGSNTLEEALVAFLLAQSAIAGLVGNRISWGLRDQGGLLPAIAMHIVSAAPIYSDGGEEAQITDKRVQIDCWGLTYASAKKTARAVETAMSGAARFTYAGVTFQAMWTELEQDLVELGVGAEPILFRTSLDFQLSQS